MKTPRLAGCVGLRHPTRAGNGRVTFAHVATAVIVEITTPDRSRRHHRPIILPVTDLDRRARAVDDGAADANSAPIDAASPISISTRPRPSHRPATARAAFVWQVGSGWPETPARRPRWAGDDELRTQRRRSRSAHRDRQQERRHEPRRGSSSANGMQGPGPGRMRHLADTGCRARA